MTEAIRFLENHLFMWYPFAILKEQSFISTEITEDRIDNFKQ
jgi:hypothetical protein